MQPRTEAGNRPTPRRPRIRERISPCLRCDMGVPPVIFAGVTGGTPVLRGYGRGRPMLRTPLDEFLKLVERALYAYLCCENRSTGLRSRATRGQLAGEHHD